MDETKRSGTTGGVVAEQPGARSQRGVLLVNLGSPDAPTPADVRRFLAEFLGDPLVVDVNRVLWWALLNLIILPLRSRRSARAYQKVWTDAGSPLVVISAQQRTALAAELGAAIPVELGMRYRRPSIEDGLRRLRDRGCDEVLVLSMFPQASQTTTGTVEVEARNAWARLGAADRALRFVAPFYDHQGYIRGLAADIRRHHDAGTVDHVLLSFHGLPTRYVEKKGDPYRDHCEATARALVAELGLDDHRWSLSYQSRFGREPWLEPNTEDVAVALAKAGKRVLVACPGFTADCLETLEEIQQELLETYRAAGGPELRVVPCLNDGAEWILGLGEIVREALDARS